MDAHEVPSLRWRLTADDTVHVKLEALAVETLTGLLAARKAAALVGADGQQLVLRPGGKTAAAWAHQDETLELRFGKALAATMGKQLGPWCGDYEFPELPGFRLEVIESKVLDADGKVERIVGWDGRPDPPVRAELNPKHPAPPERPRRLGRRLLLTALGLVVLGPIILVAVAFAHLRHVPYTIPPELVAPAPKTQLSAALGMGLRVRWLGISGYEISDGKTIILADPTLTRPSLGELLTGPIEVDPETTKSLSVADYIIVNHAHFDHVADVPAIAKRTGAVVLGSPSVINLCKSRGIPPDKLRVVENGQRLKLGTFDVIVRQTVHTAIKGIENPMSGTIPENAGPLWFWEYANDGTYSYRLEANGTSLWFHPTSTFLRDAQELWPPAKNLILGVTGEPFTREKMKLMLSACRPRWLIPTHYDNFFQPLSAGLSLMPEADLAKVARLCKELDPELKFTVLDFDQTVYLPPD